MTQEALMSVITDAVWTVIQVAAPPLLMGLTTGVLVSVFQTITSIQEQTLSFVPKILSVMFSLLIFGSYMITTLEEFIIRIYNDIPNLVIPR